MRTKKIMSLFIVTLLLFATIVTPAQAAGTFTVKTLTFYGSSNYATVMNLIKLLETRQNPVQQPVKPAQPPTDTTQPPVDKTPVPTTTQPPVDKTPTTPTTTQPPVDKTTTPPTTTQPPVQGQSQIGAFEMRVIELVNQERAKNNLKPLKADVALTKGARLKSEDMRDKGYFSHTSPTYGSPFAMMTSLGIKWQAAGENIASGYRTPESVMQGWMNSPGHRANILSTKWSKMGTGFAQGGKSGYYWTQWFSN